MKPYFRAFDHVRPPATTYMSPFRHGLWHVLAGLTAGLALWYLHWRWTASLNPDAMVFSVSVAIAETMAFIGTVLSFHDIWREQDTPKAPPPGCRRDAHLEDDGNITVDLFITTFDESTDIVGPSITDAKALKLPAGVSLSIHVLDDGGRDCMRDLANRQQVNYLRRENNIGYKAGNLCSALMQTRGDFVLICDADTRVFPGFLMNTLGYFRDPKVAWVQTPQWFYDIPQGRDWMAVLSPVPGALRPYLVRIMGFITGEQKIGRDPFLSDPVIFFDIIQRRRNRNNASFCCGAGSIHRREAVFSNALHYKGQQVHKIKKRIGEKSVLHMVQLEPYKFHVSEDIYTSILMQARGWKSVFHPDIEARMLSPMTMQAWSTQRLKYAGGTFDIMLRANPLLMGGIPAATKLHYGATFWSYLAVLWMPVLLFAPVVSLFTALSPVKAFSLEFFVHLLPALLVNELAMHVACKGYSTHAGRVMAIATIPLQIKGLFQVLRQKKLGFPTTPKTLFATQRMRYAIPAIMVLLLFLVAVIWGVFSTMLHIKGYSSSLLVVNLFWIFWGGLSFVKIIRMSLWTPPGPHMNKRKKPPAGGLLNAQNA